MDIQRVIDYLWNFGEKATSHTMRLHAFLFLTLALCSISGFAQASTAGSSCSIAGAQERDSGQILICNGTTWVETIQTTNAGRSLFQIGSGTLKFSAVDAGDAAVCALGNGDLYCWGDAAMYQLGNASTTDLYVPTKIGTDKWQQLSSDGHSASHHCGIKPDKTLWCWGSNSNTQIGNNSYTDAQTPTNISGANAWLVIAPEQIFTCGVRASGALYCWGTETAQQLGNGASGTTGTPTLIGSASWKWVTTGYQHACGIQSDNSLWCWGSNTSGQLGDGTGAGTYNVPTKIGTDTWKSVSASSSYTCGIKTDDTLWCWGSAGNHGDGTNAQKNSPGQVGSAQWRKVSAGGGHACGIQTDGTLWCWGSENWNAETSFPSSANRLTAAQVGSAKWIDISTGFRYTCGIQTDNTLWCWGRNPDGQLGRGSTSAYSATVATTSVSTAASTTCPSYETGRLRYNETGGSGSLSISGLVGYWPMDETSGTSVADLSGNSNTGTMTNMDGATDHVPGVIGNGLDFDGTNDYVNAGSGASLDDLGDMTMCAWIYFRGTTVGAFATTISKYDSGMTTGWDLYYAGEGMSETGRGYIETIPSATNAWNHYCATNADTGTNGSGLAIYKNGSLMGVQYSGAYNTLGSDAANNLYFGSANDLDDPLNAILDEVRIYNRVLSVGEIQQIYNYAGSSSAGFWQYCDGANWVDF